ncbi:MAG: methyltransferase domain-containing protein [Patescibacteria group bacterium]
MSLIEQNNVDHFKELISKRKYSFLDFGTSKGNSIKFAKSIFNPSGLGLGIDIDQNKIDTALSCGYDAINFNIENIPEDIKFDFCIMSHFLEHLDDIETAKRMIIKSCKISNKFVYIQQPCFDSDGYLFKNKLKLFFSHWHGHTLKLSSLDFHNILQELKEKGLCTDFSIQTREPIFDSNHTSIHPIESPLNQQKYNSNIHPPKPQTIKFEVPVFAEIIVIISKSIDIHKDISSKVKDRRQTLTMFDTSPESEI